MMGNPTLISVQKQRLADGRERLGFLFWFFFIYPSKYVDVDCVLMNRARARA